MSSVFRKSAMERLASPDRLDCMLKVTSPLSWIGILVAGLITIIVVIWSFVGKIPSTISTIGFLVNSYNTNTLYCTASGTVSEIEVKEGNKISKGDIILTVFDSKGNKVNIKSEQTGIVSEILVEKGVAVTPNLEILRISPITDNDLTLVCYVGLDIAKQLKEGMKTKVYLSSVDSEKYGYMIAEITNIDSYITSNNAMNEILGADGQMAYVLTSNGPLVAVSCELKNDSNSKSGYYFSNSKAKNIEITSGEQAKVQFTLDESSPISKVFPKLGRIK